MRNTSSTGTVVKTVPAMTCDQWVTCSPWNDLFWPLIAITSSRTYTVQVGLTTFQGEHITHWSQVMAGTVLTTVPVLLVFLIGQRRFVQAITGAVKG